MKSDWTRIRALVNPLLIILASLITFLVPVLQGKTLGPWAQIRHLAPWNGPAPTRPWDVLQADSVLQFFGWRQQVFQAWNRHQVPWWNPHILNGTPLLANSQSGALYPPHILIGLLGISGGLGIMLLAILHLAWAGLGCYFLLCKLKASEFGALFGAAAFASSSFMIAWTPLSSVTETVSWIPWCLFAAHCLATGRERKLSSGIWLGFAVGMMILAGHLQFAFYGIIATMIWLIIAWIWPRPTPDISDQSPEPLSASARPAEGGKASPLMGGTGIVAAVVVAGLVCWLQLGPVLKLGQQSHRRASPSESGYAAYVSSSDQWTELASIASPSLLGTPNQGVPAGGQDVVAYWPAYTYRGANFAETAFSWGPLVFFAVFLGIAGAYRKRLIPIIAIGAVGGLLAFGTTLNRLLYHSVPGWAATGSPGRAGCLLVLAGCLLGGLALSNVDSIHLKSGIKRGLICLAIALAIGIFFMNLSQSSVWNPSFTKLGIMGAIGPNVLVGAAESLILAAFLAGFLSIKASPVARNIGIVILCFLQPLILYPVLSFGHPNLPLGFKPNGRLAIVMGQWSLLASPPALAPPNTAYLSGIDGVGGYDSLIRKEAQVRLEAIDQGSPSPPENGNMMTITPNFDPSLLADAGVSEVWSAAPLPQMKTQPHVNSFVYRYSLPGPGRASTPTGQAQVIHEDAQSITVEATGPGPLTLRDDLGPDWEATVSGQNQGLSRNPWPTVQLTRSGPQKVRFFSMQAERLNRVVPILFATLFVLFLVNWSYSAGLWRKYPPNLS